MINMDRIPNKVDVEFNNLKIKAIMVLLALVVIMGFLAMGISMINQHRCVQECVDKRHCFDQYKISQSNEETRLLEKCLREPDDCSQQCRII